MDHQLNCVKGGGACHLREKVIAEAANTFATFLSFKMFLFANFNFKSFILVADYRKNVQYLGTNVFIFLLKCAVNLEIISFLLKRPQGVPVEVVPFAYAKVLQDLHKLGSPKAALRIAVMKGKLKLLMSLVPRLISILTLAGPVVTDNGNFVIDAPFDHERMLDPYVVSKPFSPTLPQDSE